MKKIKLKTKWPNYYLNANQWLIFFTKKYIWSHSKTKKLKDGLSFNNCNVSAVAIFDTS